MVNEKNGPREGSFIKHLRKKKTPRKLIAEGLMIYCTGYAVQAKRSSGPSRYPRTRPQRA